MKIRKSNCWYRLALSFLLAGLIIAASAIQADTSDDDSSIRIVGDSAEADLADGESSWSFIGNVKLERGAMTLTAERMTVQRVDGKVTAVVAVGTPVRFTQNEPNKVTASSSTMTYSVDDQTIVLAGNVELVQAGNEIRGERIEYDLQQGELLAGSADPSGGEQIEFVLDESN